MKKSTLTAFIIMLGAIGLMAQSKKADTDSKAKTKAIPYTLTHLDSVKYDKASKNSKTRPAEDSLVPNSAHLRGNINDVIDVEHEIK